MDKTRPADGFIARIEAELLSSLFKYVIPFLDKKTNIQTKKEAIRQSSLESILDNSKPKIGIEDLKELERLLLDNAGKNAKADKKMDIGSGNIFYSLNLQRQKNKDQKTRNYSISIEYGETQTGEMAKASIKESGKEVYSAEVSWKKDSRQSIAPYSIKITYEENYAEERLTIMYRQQLKSYMKQHIADKEDMTNRVPLKWLNILPESQMGGVLGFTYLGENFMGRRADLTGNMARMVDIHESIHTPDEYETRVLTSWIMGKIRGKYVK